jgi:hypothetical protein
MPATRRQRFAAILAIAMLFMCPLATLQADKIIDATQYSGPCYNETVYRLIVSVYYYSSDYCGSNYDGPYYNYDSFGVEVCPNDYFEYLDHSEPFTVIAEWYDETCGNQSLEWANDYYYW